MTGQWATEALQTAHVENGHPRSGRWEREKVGGGREQGRLEQQRRHHLPTGCSFWDVVRFDERRPELH